MNTRNFSLIIAGCLWIAVAARIGSRGLAWLQPYFQTPDWHLALLALSIVIGIVKALTILRKVVVRNTTNNLEKIDDSPINYLIGWIKLLGYHSCIMITLMMGLGIGLRFWRSHGGDPYNIFGFFYLGIALALAGSSFFYFKAINKNN